MRKAGTITALGAVLCLLGTFLALGAFFLPAYSTPPQSLWAILVLLVYVQPHLQFGLVPLSVSILLLLLLGTTVLAVLTIVWRAQRRNLLRWHGGITILTMLYYGMATLVNLFLLWIIAEIADGSLSDLLSPINMGAWLIPTGLLLGLLGSFLLARPLEENANIARLWRLFAAWPFGQQRVRKLLIVCLGVTVLSVGGLGLADRGPLAFLGSPITEFAVPTSAGDPEGITLGPDGNLWFAEVDGNKIGRITPSGVITEFAVPSLTGEPEGITRGPDGNLWFTESGDSKIGRITSRGSITEFSLPTPYSVPEGITAGPDGALWFTENNGVECSEKIDRTVI